MEQAVPRDPKLTVLMPLWEELLADLHQRTQGYHESGAFLLGRIEESGRRVERVVYYDDLDRNAYRTGVVVMHAASFGPLWDLCRSSGLSVVADIHVHPEGAWQSWADRDNPMIALAGHLALIVPNFAEPPVLPETLGLYEYLGAHRWRNFSGKRIGCCLNIVKQEDK
jgi:proteasome lid subunit RPN8/RPN11